MSELSLILVESRYNTEPIIKRHLDFLPSGVRVFCQTKGVHTIQDYNELLTSAEFWRQIKGDRVLVIQHDSELLRTGLESFIEYDYVGAPWRWQWHGGNGGLSLRSQEAMRKTIERVRWNGENEDVYFSNNLQGNLAPRNICEEFSCETIFRLGTLGAHAIDEHLTASECELIRKQYF